MNSITANRMGRRSTRRNFIKTTAMAAGGGLYAAGVFDLPALAAATAAAPRPLIVACRDAHLKATGQADCWSALKMLGAAGVEVDVNEKLECPLLFHPEKKYSLATSEGVKALQTDLEVNQVQITAFCLNNRFDERLERELDCIKALLPAARTLAVKAIRLDVVPRALTKEKFLPFAIKTCQQLCALAEATEVRYGIENHGHTTNDPAFLSALFAGVDSKRLGLTLDANNLYWYGHPLDKVYGVIEQFASRCFHTHCKNIKYPEEKRQVRRPVGWEYEKYNCPLAEGDLDYPRIVSLLKRANYPGDLCLEIECLHHFPAAEHPAVLKKEMTFLRGLA
jgi:sugar phosphate isomerase/epimerase